VSVRPTRTQLVWAARRVSFAALILTLNPNGATAQIEPGWGFDWEQVGNVPLRASAVAVGPGGVMWAAADSLRWLDESEPPGVWRAAPGIGSCTFVLPLGQDTLVVLRGRGYRSVDNGGSFVQVSDFGRDVAVEVPAGHAEAGRLLMGTLQNATGAAWSDDRGANWTQAAFTTGRTDNRVYHLAAVPEAAAPARVLAAGVGGLYVSDDAGLTYRAGPVHNYGVINGRFVAVLPQSGGGHRSILLLNAGQPFVSTYSSDDAGDTWSPGPPLVEPQGTGLGWPAVRGLVDLGDGHALAVLGRGRIHRTDDAGLTWQEVAQTPRETDGVTVNHAALGPDGRLYVAMAVTGASPEGAWVYRTTDVVVAQEGPARGRVRSTLTVRPNPATGEAATVDLTLPAAVAVTITLHDALGRRVSLLHAGPLAAGRHAFSLPASLPAGVYVARGAGASIAFTVRPAGR
jgi:photosystem II stability/assembly factor-like uncharacterized protein